MECIPLIREMRKTIQKGCPLPNIIKLFNGLKILLAETAVTSLVQVGKLGYGEFNEHIF